jgi:methionyl aminopeptidase
MITIKNKIAFEKMTVAGNLLGTMFLELPSFLKAGMSTLAVDSWIADYLSAHQLVSSCKGYMGYKHVSCISLNDEVVHGVPNARRIMRDGDLVKIDVCASWKGYCADMARCFFIGTPSPQAQNLVNVAMKALDKAIEVAKVGNRLTDISAAIQKYVESHGFGVVRDFAGHGIGKRMHEAPEILNYGQPGKGPKLCHGMSFAIEPMITMGDYKVYVDNDGWTAKTIDKSLAAHVEDTVLVTDHGPLVVTRVDV